MSEFVSVAHVDDIPVGKGKAFEVGERVIAVFNDNGELFAIDDMCPHMGASLADGCLQDSAVTCPWHAWSFDVRDGSWCDNRRLKTDTFSVRIVDDRIEVASEPNAKSEDDLSH
jgi:nitrite reductase (NADH) small subunit/3-phenylpropionate/trans-cinnamate dioxygenase ferredoxin subunit